MKLTSSPIFFLLTVTMSWTVQFWKRASLFSLFKFANLLTAISKAIAGGMSDLKKIKHIN